MEIPPKILNLAEKHSATGTNFVFSSILCPERKRNSSLVSINTIFSEIMETIGFATKKLSLRFFVKMIENFVYIRNTKAFAFNLLTQ